MARRQALWHHRSASHWLDTVLLSTTKNSIALAPKGLLCIQKGRSPETHDIKNLEKKKKKNKRGARPLVKVQVNVNVLYSDISILVHKSTKEARDSMPLAEAPPMQQD